MRSRADLSIGWARVGEGIFSQGSFHTDRVLLKNNKGPWSDRVAVIYSENKIALLFNLFVKGLDTIGRFCKDCNHHENMPT